MKKKIWLPVVASMFLVANSMPALAATTNESSVETNTSTKISPNIAVSKKVSVLVEYYNVVKPPSTYKYEVYDYEYGVVMKGTLTLDHYSHDGNVTYAYYKGTIHGNI